MDMTTFFKYRFVYIGKRHDRHRTTDIDKCTKINYTLNNTCYCLTNFDFFE